MLLAEVCNLRVLSRLDYTNPGVFISFLENMTLVTAVSSLSLFLSVPSGQKVWARRLFNYCESVLFRTWSASGWLCVHVYVGPCMCSGGAVPVILSQLIAALGDSSPPLVSWGFRCIQVSLPEHTQAPTYPGCCLGSWIPVCLQSVSIWWSSYWQTHCVALCFSFQVDHYHLLSLSSRETAAAKDHWLFCSQKCANSEG